MLLMACLALAETIAKVPNERDPQGFGIGVVLGLPTGLTVAFKPELKGFWGQATLGWEFTTGTMAVQIEGLYTLATLHSKEIDDFSWPLYIGVGPRFRLFEATSAYAPPVVGIRVPMGLGFYHEGVPVEGYFELAPVLGLYPRPRAAFDVVIGGRWYL